MFHMLACYWSTVDWVAAYGSRFALFPEKADRERERGVAAHDRAAAYYADGTGRGQTVGG